MNTVEVLVQKDSVPGRWGHQAHPQGMKGMGRWTLRAEDVPFSLWLV